MSSPAEMHERHARMLARYAELALSLAEQLHADAMAAETPDQRAGLAGAFHRICRSGRQSMALEARLVREAAREARAEAGLGQAAREARIELRKKRLAQAVEPLIWTEVEDEDQVEALQDLELCLAEAALCEAFLDEPLETQLARLCDALRLPNPPPAQSAIRGRWPEGPEGVATLSARPDHTGPQPPQSLRDSSPSGGASEDLAFDAAPPPNSS